MRLAKLGKHIIKLDGQEIELWIGKNTLSLIAPENTKLTVTLPYFKPQTYAHKDISIQVRNW